MKITYRIQVKSIDEGLTFLEAMRDKVQIFLDKFPDTEYSESIEKLDNGKFAISIGATDGKDEGKQVFKEFEGIAEAFGKK